MSKQQKRVEDMSAFSRASVYAIFFGDKLWGKVLVSHPVSGGGRTDVALYDYTRIPGKIPYQQSSASGGNYDKVQACLSGMQYAGIEIDEEVGSWEYQLVEQGYQVRQLV